MRRCLVAGNWKMNLCRAEAESLARAVAVGAGSCGSVDLVLAPPAPYLSLVAAVVAGTPVGVAGQNASAEKFGAFTGEIAVEMLLDTGCRYVILGHSERRQLFGESDQVVNAKVKRAVQAGLHPILCIGEVLQEREEGRTESVLVTQLNGSLANVTADDMSRLVIAYEPVWAIGTGRVASVEQAEAAHRVVRDWLSARFGSVVSDATRILYGGSVKPDNAAGLLSQPNVDGALVGGASLVAESFLGIARAGVSAGR